jgi:cytoskeletal protein RodZ
MGYPGAEFKSFATVQEATSFVDAPCRAPTRYFAHQSSMSDTTTASPMPSTSSTTTTTTSTSTSTSTGKAPASLPIVIDLTQPNQTDKSVTEWNALWAKAAANTSSTSLPAFGKAKRSQTSTPPNMPRTKAELGGLAERHGNSWAGQKHGGPRGRYWSDSMQRSHATTSVPLDFSLLSDEQRRIVELVDAGRSLFFTVCIA